MHIDERGSLGEQPRHQQKRQERQAAFVDEDAERIHQAEPNSAGQHRPREVSSATSPVLSDRGHNSEIGEADGRAAQRSYQQEHCPQADRRGPVRVRAGREDLR